MKRFIAVFLAMMLCFSVSAAFCEENPRLVTVQEWMDEKGPENSMLIVQVVQILNPVLASVRDETGTVNLFGLNDNGEFQDLFTSDIQAGDLLVLKNPVYNEYEGTVEMAESVLLRKARFGPAVYEYTVSPDEEINVSDQVFNGDVYVYGEGQAIRFWNCTFNGNLICCSASATMVWVLDGCVFNNGGHCILRSGVREADMNYAIPKFALMMPVEVECEDLGGVMAAGDFDVVFAGKDFNAGNLEYFQKEDGSIVPFEEGMTVNGYVVMHWWENGEEVLFTIGG